MRGLKDTRNFFELFIPVFVHHIERKKEPFLFVFHRHVYVFKQYGNEVVLDGFFEMIRQQRTSCVAVLLVEL